MAGSILTTSSPKQALIVHANHIITANKTRARTRKTRTRTMPLPQNTGILNAILLGGATITTSAAVFTKFAPTARITWITNPRHTNPGSITREQGIPRSVAGQIRMTITALITRKTIGRLAGIVHTTQSSITFIAITGTLQSASKTLRRLDTYIVFAIHPLSDGSNTAGAITITRTTL